MEDPPLPSKEQYFQHKLVAITGGSGGIGNALAQELSRLGTDVHILDIHQPQFHDGKMTFHTADVSDNTSIANAASRIDHVDLLIVAAGITSKTNEPSNKEIASMNAVNVYGVQNTLDAFMPILHEHAQVVFIGTDDPPKEEYRRTKEEGRRIVQSFSKDHSEKKVTTILLGPVRTPLFEEGKPQEVIERIAKNVGLYEPEEFAQELIDKILEPRESSYQEVKMYKATS